MTTIAAISDGTRAWIGSDSMVVGGRTIYPNVCVGGNKVGSKWLVCDDFAIGLAGDVRAMDLITGGEDRLRDGFDGGSVFGIISEIEKLFENFVKDTELGPRNFIQDIIIAFPSMIYAAGATLALVPIRIGELWSEGSGDRFALGSFHAQRAVSPDRDLDLVVRTSIEAAAQYDPSTGGLIGVQELCGKGG